MHVYESLQSKGWELRYISGPTGFHVTVTLSNLQNITKNFTKDFKDGCTSVIYLFNLLISCLKTEKNLITSYLVKQLSFT